ncbi:aspartic peptidase domain-containing protein [Mycena vulgaris]|nr:aspartic peptidase domain-containing protein [Mycena vulgaris]
MSSERSMKVSDIAYTAEYADGSFATYKLWNDWIYLRPYWVPPPAEEPDKPWLHLTFGVASEISASYRYAPTSGILGLGRRVVPDNEITRSPTFLQQIRPLLESPEMTILLARTHGYITFGRRPDFGTESSDGPWHNHIPLLGHKHWKFASNTKKLNGKEYRYSDGTAELDTGAAFCYVGDEFVKDYYAQIPGCTTKILGAEFQQLYHLIPVTVNATPRMELDIGGHLFTLELSHLPNAAPHPIGSTMYHVGAIQSKRLLEPVPGPAYNGPDLIGRVALINMEVVLQMPDDAPHTMSWRRKDMDFAGPSKRQWQG